MTGFLGVGNMAKAIIQAAKAAGTGDICVFDRFTSQTDGLIGVTVCPDACTLVRTCSFIFLCVKPQDAPSLLEEITPHVTEDKVMVSIMAGVSYDRLFEGLHKRTNKIIPVMPNTPLLIGYGATAMGRSPHVSDEEFSFVRRIFEASGLCEEIPCDKMCEVIPVNGSSPAFVYLFTKYAAEYAKDTGLDFEAAKRLFAQTLLGASKMMLEQNKPLDELIAQVSSKGGTTIAALESFYKDDLQAIFAHAFSACIKRAYELGK